MENGRELAFAVTVDEDIDVLPEVRSRAAQPVAHPGPATIEFVDHFREAAHRELEAPWRRLWEKGDERPGKVDRDHGQRRTPASIDQIDGR
jgi:hypothetical protein